MGRNKEINKCVECSGNITKSKASVQCAKCKNWSHVSCTGLTELELEVMHQLNNNFFCKDCKIQTRNQVRKSMESSEKQNSPRNANLNEGSESILECIKELKVEIRDLRNDLKFYAEQYEIQKEKNSIFSKEILALKKENEELGNELTKLKGQCQNKDIEDRSKNVVIMGVKSTKDEIKDNPGEVVKRAQRVLKYINPEIRVDDISIKFLVPSKDNTPMLGSFKSAEDKKVLMQKRKQIGRIVSSECHLEGNNLIYINDDLPKDTRVRFLSAKSLKEHGYKFVWVKDGKVLARKKENDPVLKIKSLDDIENLKQNIL